MKFARVRRPDGSVSAAVVLENEIALIEGHSDILELIQGGKETLASAAEEARRHGARVATESVSFLSPLATPPTVRDFYAFEQHVKAGRTSRGLEMDPDWYELPVFYFSNPYAVCGSGDVPVPPGAKRFDFELEVAAVVGGHGRNVASADGADLIVGFCVMNDWSARDVQQREMKLSLGPTKGKDTATSLGPWLVTADELSDYRTATGYDLAMECTVNGRTYSKANWSDVYWSFGEMISYASRGTDVRPGDVIGSGTCGTGCILELSQTHGTDEFPWLKPGDEVVASIAGLGELRNTVVAGDPLVPLRG